MKRTPCAIDPCRLADIRTGQQSHLQTLLALDRGLVLSLKQWEIQMSELEKRLRFYNTPGRKGSREFA